MYYFKEGMRGPRAGMVRMGVLIVMVRVTVMPWVVMGMVMAVRWLWGG